MFVLQGPRDPVLLDDLAVKAIRKEDRFRARILRAMDAEFGFDPVSRFSRDFEAEDDKTMSVARRPITAVAPCESPRGAPEGLRGPRSILCFLRRSCLGPRGSSPRHSGSDASWNGPSRRGSQGAGCGSHGHPPFEGRRERIRSSRASGWLPVSRISAEEPWQLAP